MGGHLWNSISPDTTMLMGAMTGAAPFLFVLLYEEDLKQKATHVDARLCDSIHEWNHQDRGECHGARRRTGKGKMNTRPFSLFGGRCRVVFLDALHDLRE